MTGDTSGWATSALGDDPQALLDELAAGATRALPALVAADALVVTRKRSLGDRMAGRSGSASSLRLTGAGETMTLTLDGRRLVTEVARVSGNVVISRKTPPLGEWLTAFAGQIAALASDAAGDAASAQVALASLGVRPAGAELVVSEEALESDLRTLSARVRGRIPGAALETVDRIVALLGETLPRVGPDVETAFVVRRTATDYLPETLRAYVALPSDWAERHVLADGSTAAEALVAQLAELEEAARRMRDAALEDDSRSLLDNGRFLASRFAVPPPALGL